MIRYGVFDMQYCARRMSAMSVVGRMLCCLCMLTAAMAASARPNIIVIITHDQGYGDFGVTGNTVLDTPHLDAFAGQSASFDRFYVSPVCTPTRASLMTGRYHQRTASMGRAAWSSAAGHSTGL